jgi:5'-methylthioadenosine phosphorylase
VPTVGVFGGSGFYAFLDDATEQHVDTPYGPPAGPLHLGRVGGVEVAFLPRHGPKHELPPHRVNFRANVWAMRAVGVTRLFGPCACGSLQPDVHPGDFVVCDQLVDRTSGRADTFYDGPGVHHISFADPYCPELRRVLVEAAAAEGLPVRDGGTVVTVGGPRFSTRAESRWYRDSGWHVVNMTQYPEAALARELGMCYATVALVTDYDAGLEGVEGARPVTMEEVFGFFEENLHRLRDLLFRAVTAVPAERSCSCAGALAAERLPHPLPDGAATA